MIYLRALEPEDLDLLYTIENHPSLWTVSNNNGPYSRFLLKRYLASQTGSIAEDGQMRLVVCLEADDRAIGIVDLFDYSAKHQRAEVGIALLSAEQGKGVGSETLKKLEEWRKNQVAEITDSLDKALSKNMGLEDLKKAQWYLNKLIEVVKNGNN